MIPSLGMKNVGVCTNCHPDNLPALITNVMQGQVKGLGKGLTFFGIGSGLETKEFKQTCFCWKYIGDIKGSVAKHKVSSKGSLAEQKNGVS